jgi:lysophospholipase L1-like esterase
VKRALASLTVILLWLASPGTAGASAERSPALPNSIAAIGDSISQAADVCCFYGDHPGKSWSIGGDADSISSHYERILAGNPGIGGNNFNDAVSGAKMSDAAGQATQAVGQGAEYVTILMGGNDVCTPTIDSMTSVEDFRAQFQSAMSILESGLPADAHIFVSSIPNIYRLWKIFHDNPLAQLVWAAAQICQSMLSPSNSAADRRTVLQRELDFNGVLAEVCAQYANCLYDGRAGFGYQFATKDVSKLDYFHPSVSGQANLAQISWTASWWPGIGA